MIAAGSGIDDGVEHPEPGTHLNGIGSQMNSYPHVIGLFQHHDIESHLRSAKAAARPPIPAPTIATRVTDSPFRPPRQGSSGPRRSSTRPRQHVAAGGAFGVCID